MARTCWLRRGLNLRRRIAIGSRIMYKSRTWNCLSNSMLEIGWTSRLIVPKDKWSILIDATNKHRAFRKSWGNIRAHTTLINPSFFCIRWFYFYVRSAKFTLIKASSSTRYQFASVTTRLHYSNRSDLFVRHQKPNRRNKEIPKLRAWPLWTRSLSEMHRRILLWANS